MGRNKKNVLLYRQHCQVQRTKSAVALEEKKDVPWRASLPRKAERADSRDSSGRKGCVLSEVPQGLAGSVHPQKLSLRLKRGGHTF